MKSPTRESDTETGLYYYRARYYDQNAGRFLSEDSIRFNAGDSNFYRYVANAPLDFVDRSGNQIIPTVGPGAQGGLDLTDFYMALMYLRDDPSCGPIIRKLQQSPRVFHLEFIRNGQDDYDPNTKTIHWDPRSALDCSHGGRQSPALGLCHELAHAAGDGPIAQHMADTPDNEYRNREERRVIRTFETPFAIRHGEGVRHDHSGQPVTVPLPVSH